MVHLVNFIAYLNIYFTPINHTILSYFCGNYVTVVNCVMDKGQCLKFLQRVVGGCATRFREEPAHDQTLSETDQLNFSFILFRASCDRLEGEFGSQQYVLVH